MRATAPITCRAVGSRVGMAQGSAIDGPRPTDIGANASSPISDRKRKGPGPSGPWTIWSMTSNPWNKAKGSIDPNEPNRYRHADHVPIYRSRTEMVPYGPLITGRVHKARKTNHQPISEPGHDFDIGSSPRQTDRPELSRRILTRMVQAARRESQADIESSFRTSHPGPGSSGS